jgi:hypothetical protein
MSQKTAILYRITAILKVETDIIASIASTSRGLAVMLVIIYVVIFITGVIVFIGDIEIDTDIITFITFIVLYSIIKP